MAKNPTRKMLGTVNKVIKKYFDFIYMIALEPNVLVHRHLKGVKRSGVALFFPSVSDCYAIYCLGGVGH